MHFVKIAHTATAMFVALLILAASPGRGEVLFSESVDYQVRYNYANSTLLATLDSTNSSMALGEYQQDRASNLVFIFKMPKLTPGQVITVESFKLSTNTTNYSTSPSDNAPFGVDLYGLGFQEGTATINKYLDSNSDNDETTVKLIDNWFREDSVSNASSITTNTSQSLILTDYMKSFYQDPSHADYGVNDPDWYMFLRVNPDKIPLSASAAITGYTIFMGSDSNDNNKKPSLTISVPEPASLGLVSVVACLLGRRRCSRPRG